MVEVIVEPTQGGNVGGMMQMVLNPLRFMIQHWVIILLGILLIVAIILLINTFMANSDLNKERDEPGYYLYKKTVRDCLRNQDKRYYKKVYSKWNLVWFGLPIKWVDKSKRVVNKYSQPLGFYRGHIESQDGTFCLLICTSTIFGLFDTKILVKIPVNLTIKVPDKATKKFKSEQMTFDLISRDMDGTYILDCLYFEQTALYYYMPVFKRKDINSGEDQIIDLRKFVEGNINDSVYQVMLQRVLNTSQKQMEKAMLLNPNLKYQQMSPQKTAPESSEDEDN